MNSYTCKAAWVGENPTFRRKISYQSSGMKSNPSKKATQAYKAEPLVLGLSFLFTALNLEEAEVSEMATSHLHGFTTQNTVPFTFTPERL
jgi:hypothetical protein